MSLEQCSLERLLETTRQVAEPGESYGVIVAGDRDRLGVRVVVGREVLAHIEAPTLDAAIVKAVDVVESHALEASGQQAFAEAASW